MIRTSIGLNSDGKSSAVFRGQSQIFLLFKDRVTLSTPYPIAFAADVKFHGVLYRVNCRATCGQLRVLEAEVPGEAGKLQLFSLPIPLMILTSSIFSARSCSFSARRWRIRWSYASRSGKEMADYSTSKCLGPRLQRTFGAFSILNLENIFKKTFFSTISSDDTSEMIVAE